MYKVVFIVGVMVLGLFGVFLLVFISVVVLVLVVQFDGEVCCGDVWFIVVLLGVFVGDGQCVLLVVLDFVCVYWVYIEIEGQWLQDFFGIMGVIWFFDDGVYQVFVVVVCLQGCCEEECVLVVFEFLIGDYGVIVYDGLVVCQILDG